MGAKNIKVCCNPVVDVGIEAVWTLVFNINLCIELGISIPSLVIPGIMIGDGYMHIYCKNKNVIIDTISPEDADTIVMYPVF